MMFCNASTSSLPELFRQPLSLLSQAPQSSITTKITIISGSQQNIIGKALNKKKVVELKITLQNLTCYWITTQAVEGQRRGMLTPPCQPRYRLHRPDLNHTPGPWGKVSGESISGTDLGCDLHVCPELVPRCLAHQKIKSHTHKKKTRRMTVSVSGSDTHNHGAGTGWDVSSKQK